MLKKTLKRTSQCGVSAHKYKTYFLSWPHDTAGVLWNQRLATNFIQELHVPDRLNGVSWFVIHFRWRTGDSNSTDYTVKSSLNKHTHVVHNMMTFDPILTNVFPLC